MRRMLALAFLALALPAAGGHKRPDVLTARWVQDEIASRGPRETLARLYDDEHTWEQVTGRIADGSREWLEVAERLLEVAQDPEAYDLEAAVGEALASAPARVLEHADDRLEIAISWVCGETATFGEEPSTEELIAILAEREKAVRKVREPALASKRDACLGELAKALRTLERELREATRKIG